MELVARQGPQDDSSERQRCPVGTMGLGKVYRPPVSQKTGLAGKCLNGIPRDSRDRGWRRFRQAVRVTRMPFGWFSVLISISM